MALAARENGRLGRGRMCGRVLDAGGRVRTRAEGGRAVSDDGMKFGLVLTSSRGERHTGIINN